MMELILSFTIAFYGDFDKPMKNLEFRIMPLDTLNGRADKNGDCWVIALDSAIVSKLHPEELKSLVYHELGHTIGLLDTNRRRDFMNPIYSVFKYKNLNTYNYDIHREK